MDNLEAGKLTEYCELLNNITNLPENKKCFDCVDDNSPRYLCATFLTFVCSCCASVHQEFGHKIKVLSVFGFTTNEIDVLKETGNRVATDKWLARWNPERFDEPDPTSPSYKEDARNYMRAKYIEKKWVKPLPPPLPIGETITRKAAEGTPIRRNSDVDTSPREGTGADADPETDTSSLLRHRGGGGGSGNSSTEVSPRGQGGQQTEEVSPRRYVSASPKRYSMEVTPSKRYSTEVSPRGYNEAEAMYEEAFKQHDVIKPTFNPFLSDPFPAATPSVVYIPQPFLLPMSFPPTQYGYPQYPMPMDMNQFPPYYSRPTIPFQPYPYDTIQASNAAMSTSWADADVIKLRQQQQQQHTHAHTHTQRMHQSSKELPRLPSDESLHHPPVLRSASDNSLATTMRLAAEEAAANECNCKLINSTNSSTVTTPSRASEQTVSKTELNKQKIQGLVNKMTGLLKRSQN